MRDGSPAGRHLLLVVFEVAARGSTRRSARSGTRPARGQDGRVLVIVVYALLTALGVVLLLVTVARVVLGGLIGHQGADEP